LHGGGKRLDRGEVGEINEDEFGFLTFATDRDGRGVTFFFLNIAYANRL